MSVPELIKGHDLFRSLSFDEIGQIDEFSASAAYRAGETVFTDGAPASHFFVVIDGCVNLQLPSRKDDSAFVVTRMEKGDILGMSPLLGFDRYSSLAQCAEDSTILRVDAAPFRELLNRNAPVGAQVMNVIAQVYFARYIDMLGRIQTIMGDVTVR